SLAERIAYTAFAFRGYNETNLGRSGELLAHPVYGDYYADALRRASEECSDAVGHKVDLVDRVRRGEETSLATYAEAISLIVAVEQAQIQILRSVWRVDYSKAAMTFGYSLGEISALVASGVLEMNAALRIPLSLAAECVELAHGVTLGIFFSRRSVLPLEDVNRLCLTINHQGRGVMGVSAYLSPNSILLMGQQDTLQRFGKEFRDSVDRKVHLRMHGGDWPPLHTPILWDKCIPNRAARMLHTLPGGFTAPTPPVLSLVTGKTSYNDYNAREIIHRWVDHPQRLWDAVFAVLNQGVERVVHVGPAPNIIPSTFKRLADNVDAQTRGRLGVRTLKAIVPHPWLKRILPDRAALLRAPLVEQVILEDWLLAQPVGSAAP
ncbi:MAG: ACP S-malonyltransferase, partial [Planctomycetales bacterium]|nr:ACP S-malonyltransferase [Planctomycetales bacterium]